MREPENIKPTVLIIWTFVLVCVTLLLLRGSF
jgi:hypothetical protein